jgi:hypothetical protein
MCQPLLPLLAASIQPFTGLPPHHPAFRCGEGEEAGCAPLPPPGDFSGLPSFFALSDLAGDAAAPFASASRINAASFSCFTRSSCSRTVASSCGVRRGGSEAAARVSFEFSQVPQ